MISRINLLIWGENMVPGIYFTFDDDDDGDDDSDW